MRRFLGLLLLLVLLPCLAWSQTTPVNANLVVTGHINSCTTGPSGTTGSAYACTLGYAITAYQPNACYAFVADVANSGSASLNLHSLGAKTISKVVGGVTTALAANDIRTGQRVEVCYDATNDRMQMQGPVGNPPAFTDLTGIASDAQIPDLNTLSTGLTGSRCVETTGGGLLTVAASACGTGGGAAPGGSVNQVQYHVNSTTLGGTSGLVVDSTSLLSTAPRITSLTASKNPLDTTDGPVINCAPSTASNVTLTLPVAATTTQRKWSIIKTNATTTFGQCLVDGNGSETINGSTGTLAAATQFSRVDCDLDKTTATANWSCVAGKTSIDLAADVGTSILPIANGGTGTATPVRSIYLPAGSMDVEGSCALGTAATLVTTGPKLPAMTCTDANTDGINLDFVMPDGWNGGTITVELVGFYVGTPTAGQIFAMNFSGQCVRSGDPVAAWAVTSGATATSGTNVAANLTMVATANLEYHTTSTALTLAGTCTGNTGPHVYLHGLVNAGTTNLTTIANLKILGVKVEYTRTAND